jgi:hypothetical protein
MRHVQKLGDGMYVAFCVSISSEIFYRIFTIRFFSLPFALKELANTSSSNAMRLLN